MIMFIHVQSRKLMLTMKILLPIVLMMMMKKKTLSTAKYPLENSDAISLVITDSESTGQGNIEALKLILKERKIQYLCNFN